MDEGCAAILGALIGAGATLAGSVVTPYLQNKRANSLADIRRKRLKSLLEDKSYEWRSIETLAASIGADESVTMELLIEVDARAEMKNKRLWALVSRKPYPTSDAEGSNT